MAKKIISIALAIIILFENAFTTIALESNDRDMSSDHITNYIIKLTEEIDDHSLLQSLSNIENDISVSDYLANSQFRIISAPRIDQDKIDLINQLDFVEYIVPDNVVELFDLQKEANSKDVEELMEKSNKTDFNSIVIASIKVNSNANQNNGVFVYERNKSINDASRISEIDIFVEQNTNDDICVSDIIRAIEHAKNIDADIIYCNWNTIEFNYALKDSMISDDVLFISSDNNGSNDYPWKFGINNVVSANTKNINNADQIQNANIVAGVTQLELAMVIALVKSVNNASVHEIVAALNNLTRSNEKNVSSDNINSFYNDLFATIERIQIESISLDIEKALDKKVSEDLVSISQKQFDEITDEERQHLISYYEIDTEHISVLNEQLDLVTSISVLVNGNKAGLTENNTIRFFEKVNDYDSTIEFFDNIDELKHDFNLSNKDINEFCGTFNDNADVEKIDEMFGALVATKVWNADFPQLVNSDTRNTFDDVKDDLESIDVEDRQAYLRLLLEFNLSSEGLNEYIASKNKNAGDLLESLLSWQETNDVFLTAPGITALSSGGSPNIPTVYNKYQTPAASDEMNNISVNNLFGLITYNKDLLSLTGKNGLDLNFGLRYDTDDALTNSEYADVDKLLSVYCAEYTTDMYHLQGDFSQPDITNRRKQGAIYSDPKLHNQMIQVSSFEEGGWLYVVKDVRILSEDKGYTNVNGQRTKSFYQKLYDLGAGWSYNFPAFEDNSSINASNQSVGKKVLHFSDGQKYTVKYNTSTQKYELLGYDFKDIVFSEVSASTFVSNGRNSKWMITYKNGRRDFLDSTGRYIGSAGKDIGVNTERIEVHYNSDNKPSEIIDTVGRRIAITYRIEEIVDEFFGDTYRFPEIDYTFFDINDNIGELLYTISQNPTLHVGNEISNLRFYDHGEVVKNTRFGTRFFDTTLWYNCAAGYINGGDDMAQLTSQSPVLDTIQDNTFNDGQTYSAETKIVYEFSYRKVTDASVANGMRVKSIANTTYNFDDYVEETRSKKVYDYRITNNITGKSRTQFLMNAWNDNSWFNDDTIGITLESALYPKIPNCTYELIISENPDDNGNNLLHTSNYYNDQRQLFRVNSYQYNPGNGQKKQYSQTDIEYSGSFPQKEITRLLGNGIELVTIKETKYDEYSNIIESHLSTGTSNNFDPVQNIKKQETLYRTFGENKYIPTLEKKMLSTATGTENPKWIFTKNTIAPSGNDIARTKIIEGLSENEEESFYGRTFDYIYDLNYFNIIRTDEHAIGDLIRKTYHNYDVKYNLYVSDVKYISGSGNTTLAHYYYQYNKYGRVTEFKNIDESHVTQYDYDSFGNVINTRNPDNTNSSYDINLADQYVIETTKDSQKIKYVYDDFNQLIEEYLFDGTDFVITQKHTYDFDNRISSTYQYKAADASKFTKTTYTYDFLDRVLNIKCFDENNNLLSHEENTYEIVNYNQIPSEKHTTITHNGNRPSSRKIEYMDSAGNVIAVQNEYAPNQFYTDSYVYSDYGLLAASYGDTISRNDYVYDCFGRVVTVKDANENSKSVEYDLFGRVVRSTDENDNLTTYKYDDLDRITATKYWGNKDVQYRYGFEDDNAAYNVIKQEYDVYGNVSRTENAYNSTYYSYDNNDSLVQVEEQIYSEVPRFTQYCYDEADRIIRQFTGLSSPLDITGQDTYISPNDEEFAVTKYYYDYKGNAVKTVFPTGKEETYQYSFDNKLISKHVGEDLIADYSYDSLGRVVTEVQSGNSTNFRFYNYDSIGNLLSISDGDNGNNTINYSYNLLGQLLTESKGNDYNIEYTYSPRGVSSYKLDVFDETSGQYQPHYYQTYNYDEMGRLRDTIQKDSSTAPVNFEVTYAYDAKSNAISQQVETPTLTTTKEISYHPLGMINGYHLTSSDDSIDITETYTFTREGYIADKYSNDTRLSNEVRTSYQYDRIGRVEKETRYNVKRFTLEDLRKDFTEEELQSEFWQNLINSADSNPYWNIDTMKEFNRIEYTYDNRNNCTSKVEKNRTTGDVITNSFDYNLGDQITSKTIYSNDINDTYSYTYDNLDNCLGFTKTGTSGYEQRVYQYDDYNRFTGAKNGSGRFAQSLYSYSYDLADRRISKLTYQDGYVEEETNHYWSGDTIIGDVSSLDNEFVSYVFGLGPIGVSSETDILSYQTNARGDIDSILEEPASIYNYDAYGNNRNALNDTTANNPYRYAGYYTDDESGFYYLNARYYDPQNASFTQRDTYLGNIAQPGTLNLYQYCGGNPVLYTDPSGHFFETLLDVAGFAWSLADMIMNPSWENLGFLLLDVAAVFVPFLPALGSGGKIIKFASRADKALDILRASDKAADAGKAIKTVITKSDDIAKGIKAGKTTISTTSKIVMKTDDAAAAIKKANEALKAKNKAALIENAAASKKIVQTASNTGSFNNYKALVNNSDVSAKALYSGKGTGGVGNPVKVEGRGTTGRVIPNTLSEQMSMHQIQSNPLQGATELPLIMNDPRWPASKGWIKMQNTVTLSDKSKIAIHFDYNRITGAFDDFKFK